MKFYYRGKSKHEAVIGTAVVFALPGIHLEGRIRRMAGPGSALRRNVWQSGGRIAPTLQQREHTKPWRKVWSEFSLLSPVRCRENGTLLAWSQMHLSCLQCPDHDLILVLCFRGRCAKKKTGTARNRNQVWPERNRKRQILVI